MTALGGGYRSLRTVWHLAGDRLLFAAGIGVALWISGFLATL